MKTVLLTVWVHIWESFSWLILSLNTTRKLLLLAQKIGSHGDLWSADVQKKLASVDTLQNKNVIEKS